MIQDIEGDVYELKDQSLYKYGSIFASNYDQNLIEALNQISMLDFCA